MSAEGTVSQSLAVEVGGGMNPASDQPEEFVPPQEYSWFMGMPFTTWEGFWTNLTGEGQTDLALVTAIAFAIIIIIVLILAKVVG